MGALLFPTVCAIFPEINLRTTPAIVWFPVPQLAVAVLIVWLCRWPDSDGTCTRSPPALGVMIAFGLALGMGVLGLVLTGLDAVVGGQAGLKGDRFLATKTFQHVYSVMDVLCAGLTEEAAIRGIAQRRLTAIVGNAKAQIWSGTLFLLLHVVSKVTWQQWLFVLVTAVVAGVLAARFRSVLVPAVFHSGANVAVAAGVLAFRI
ncbi:MAG: CPBP family intramembrane glutamic endopeptidase [Steroidobacteraceae bacterium]